MEVPFALALERGQILKLEDLNSGFTKPETIALAYYQASLLVDHIVATHGEPRFARWSILRRRRSRAMPRSARRSACRSISCRRPSTRCSTRGSHAVRAALRDQAKTAPADERPARRHRGAQGRGGRPDSYRAQLAFGAALAAQGDKAAFEPLEKAAALVPMATGDDSPHALMGGLAEKLGDPARAIKEYQALLVHDHTAIEPARRLAELAAKANDEKALAVAHDRIVELDPFDAPGHTGLGRIALKRSDAIVAMREFKAALAVGPADRAAAHCDLGESYLAAGRARRRKARGARGARNRSELRTGPGPPAEGDRCGARSSAGAGGARARYRRAAVAGARVRRGGAGSAAC